MTREEETGQLQRHSLLIQLLFLESSGEDSHTLWNGHLYVA